MGLLEVKKEPGSLPEVAVNNLYLPSKEEEEKFSILTSFNYNQFTHFTPTLELTDRALLCNAKKVYEDYLSKACAVPNKKNDNILSKDDAIDDSENRRIAMFEIYVRLGHINLLALDFPKALFAYQHAIKINTHKFRSSKSGLYGVGLVYFHFKAYNACIESFNHLLYLDSDPDFSQEVHVRLGIAHKNLGNFDKAAKHFSSAFDDVRNTQLFTKPEIKFHIAHCFDASGDLKTAFEEYKTLRDDPLVKKDPKLLANVCRALGWVCFRTDTTSNAQRSAKLAEANEYLKEAVRIDDHNSRSFYYLGRCYSEIPAGANEAFQHYRAAIDKNEHDADTWCSIGVLYQLQNQDTDALQAFICAIQINQNHNQAWACLGKLYESHFQYREALHCYKKAVYHNSSYPEPLKRRIQVIQKALSENASVILRLRSSNYKNVQPLPDLENAWNLGIPAELRPHQRQFLTLQKYFYRSGSPFWRMSELAAAYSMRHPFDELNATQREIMHILQMNEDQLEKNELSLLRHLEERFRRSEPTNDRQRHQAAETTVSNESKRERLSGDPEMRTFPFLQNNDMDFLSQLNEPSTSWENPDEPVIPFKGGELPANFSLLAPIHVPITVTADEIMERCNKRMMNPENYIPIFDEKCPPPKPDVISLKQRPTLDKLAPKTPLIKVEKPSEANSQELQNFCYKSPIALIRGLTAALKMDLSLFSTKSLIETTPDYPVEVRTQYRMPGDINVDQLGQPSWNCYSAKSHTTIGRYGSYQAESFRHSLKEETERLRAAGTGSKYAIAAAQAAAAGTPLGTIATTAPAASLLSISTPTKSDGAPPAKRRRTGQAAVNASGDQLAAAAVLAGGPDDLPIGHMPMKIVKFGTNVDLSDESKFPLQLRELNKMPAFCRNSATCNFLSHLGHTVFGMNTVQLYMKVPGCRTPGHLENNCFASVNINIGPGECEWFGVDYEYWPVIDKMCKDRGIDLMKGSWWPNFEDLVRARVPVYRFTQKAGDLVWVGGGCVHWVQSVGWCNNVAWNVGPMTAEQLQMALYSHEWNKLTNYRSLVPMQHLCWQLAINVRFSNQKIFNTVKGVLIRSLAHCRMIYDFVTTRTKMQIKRQERIKGETAHYCDTCDVEVFNYLFVKEIHNKFKVFCIRCAKKAHFDEYIVLEQQTIKELSDTFDRFQLYPAKTPLLC